MESIFGGLLEFENTQELDNFLSSLDDETALNMVELSIVYCQQNGVYNLHESHFLYKCLAKLKQKND